MRWMACGSSGNGPVAGITGKQQAAQASIDTAVALLKSATKLPLAVVGGLFRPEKIGFAAPLGSPLTRPMSLAIVADMQSGLIDRLHVKYFGDQP